MTLRVQPEDEPVTSVMTKGLLYIDPQRTVFEAASIFHDFDIGSLLVVEEGKPIGIFTTKDIVKLIAEGKDLGSICVKEVMSSPIVTIPANATLSTALVKMREHKINHLVVVDEDKVIGMINPINVLVL